MTAFQSGRAPPIDAVGTVLDLFDAAVRQDPATPALRHGERTLTYAELAATVDAAASVLVKRGLAPETPVALALSAGIEHVIAMLAVLRAGGCYVPIGVGVPPARIERMLSLCGCSWVLADAAGMATCERLAAQVSLLAFDALAADAGDGCLPPSPRPSQTACILFTSGSTGDPKGVRTLHSNLFHYADWSRHFFAATANSRVPLTAAPQYAAATSQIYACLCAGATLHILDDALGHPQRLLEFFATHPDHALHCVPTVWRAVLALLERGETGRPAALFLSGESLPPTLVERTFALDPALQVWNLYGPTECVANISARRLAPGEPIGIGRPLPGSSLFVVDEEGRELGDDEEGRLLIAGPGVCPGYLGDEARSREQFFDWVAGDGRRLAVYDTGDRACRRGDDVELRGRHDQQVKLHGVRIELADVECNLLRHPDVEQAAVLVDGDADEPRLVAFAQAKAGRTLDAGTLRRHLLAWLPASMLPERWSLQTLPQLANGKIDRAALRSQVPALAVAPVSSPSAHTSDTERRLAALFDRVLGTQGAGSADDFFALGGHSLKAYELLAAIEATWGVRLSFAIVYADPTVAALARHLPEAQSGGPGTDHATDGRLSAAQCGLWLLQQADAGSVAYNLCYRIAIDAALTTEHVRACVERLCARHELLRCTIEGHAGEPMFRLHADTAPVFTVRNLADAPATCADDVLGAFAADPLGQDGGPLHRWLLLKTDVERQVLAFAVHHLVFDGVSASLILRELAALLAGNDLPTVAGRYSDFVARQARYLASPEHAADRAFWAERFDGLSGQPAFPLRYAHADPSAAAGGRLRFTLDAAARARLMALARREHSSLHVLLLTAFAAVLDRYEPRAEFLVASPFANRLHADERDVVGYFTALLFYRLRWAAGTPLRALATRIRQDTIELLDHQRLPFPELATLLRERLRVLPPGTFRLMFGYHDSSDWHSAGLHAEECFPGEAKCDLHLECFDDGDTLDLALTYRHSALDAAAAEDWFECYRTVVDRLDDMLALQPHEWPAPSGALLARVVRDARGERIEDWLQQTVPALFESAAARFADRAAVWHDGIETSYAELVARVDALASRLTAEPAAAAGPIGICMPHQPALLVAMLACARCGIPYVPLDPSFPPQRIATIVEQAGARLLLTDASDAAPVLADVDHLDVTRVAGTAAPRLLPVKPETLLYIIYTSGSTGTPKGVMVSHRGVANYLQWMRQRFACGPDTRVLAKTSISFDISTWELLLPLISGGCVVLGRRDDTASPESLAALVVASRADVLQFVPSGLGLFVEAGMLERVPGVRQLFCGGEALPRALQTRVFETGYGGELYNLYGPTEASIFMSCHACDPASPYAVVPIGRPIPNSALYVLDEHMQPLPPNVAGDLWIGGDVLADGYWRDAAKTRDAFVDAPAWLPEKRLYRTGDKGRLLCDGAFDYLGRDDQQVKIRGYRVELREIEQHLLAHPQVQQAVAFVRQWGENDVRLHAAVVARTGASFDAAELIAWLKARLPAWMLPATLPCLQQLPHLPNGKVDYRRLRQLVDEEPASVPRHVAPAGVRDGIERKVAAIWRDVLGHADFGTRDSFFDAGGHSMLFLRVRELLREHLSADFTIAELYKAPNIAELARAYREKIGETAAAPVLAQIRARIARRRSRTLQEGE